MKFGPGLSKWLLDQIDIPSSQFVREGSRFLMRNPLVEAVLGEREAEEIQALLDRPTSDSTDVATILLPGIMGSLLASTRGISGLLWLNPTVVSSGQINLLELDERGTGDLSPDVDIVPIGLEKLVYLRLILALARETRLYEFPYDWRRHIEWNADLLARSIQRWAPTHSGRGFVLVAHSMGGLVARAYLARHPRQAEDLVERVIMLGTPLRGAAVSALGLTGDAVYTKIVSALHPDNDVARLAASFPSCYQLLPPPPNLFPSDWTYPANWDIYDAKEWGRDLIRQRYLDDARRLHMALFESDPQVDQVEIAGCHGRTVTGARRIRLEGAGHGLSTTFEPVHSDQEGHSGDGIVPLWSTHDPGTRVYYVEERHELLPGNSRVLGAVLKLVHDGEPGLPEQLPRSRGLLGRLGDTPLMQQVAELRQRIEDGDLEREDLEKLFFAR